MNTHTLDSIAALCEAVAVIRHARGLSNPDDLPADTPEWHRSADDFAEDFVRALDVAPAARTWWSF